MFCLEQLHLGYFMLFYTRLEVTVSLGRVMCLCCIMYLCYTLVWRGVVISSSVGLPVDFWALTWLGCFSSQNQQYWNTRFFQYFSMYVSKKWPTRGMLMFDFLNVIIIFQHNTLVSLRSSYLDPVSVEVSLLNFKPD